MQKQTTTQSMERLSNEHLRAAVRAFENGRSYKYYARLLRELLRRGIAKSRFNGV